MAKYEDLLTYVSGLCVCLMQSGVQDPIEWNTCVVPYLSTLMGEVKAEAACTDFMNYCATGIETITSDAGTGTSRRVALACRSVDLSPCGV